MSKSIENMSFEEALSELEAIIHKIDNGDSSLQESITAFERGAKLRNHCAVKLGEAKLKIEKIVKSNSGEVSTELVDKI